jgi:hypothetical protein
MIVRVPVTGTRTLKLKLRARNTHGGHRESCGMRLSTIWT